MVEEWHYGFDCVLCVAAPVFGCVYTTQSGVEYGIFSAKVWDYRFVYSWMQC